MEKVCRITMQFPLFQSKLKTFPLPHRCDHFDFTRKILECVSYVITVSQIARSI